MKNGKHGNTLNGSQVSWSRSQELGVSHVVVADLAGAARLPWLRRRVDTMKQGAWANYIWVVLCWFLFLVHVVQNLILKQIAFVLWLKTWRKGSYSGSELVSRDV